MSLGALTGVFERRIDETLRDVGRGRFHDRRGARHLAVSGQKRAVGLVLDARWAFVARRDRWRLAVVSLSNEEARSQAVTAWADDATTVLKGVPARQHVVGPRESWGDCGLRRMLGPESLETFLPPPWPPTFDIEGRLLDDDPSVAPEFASLGVDRYEAVFDPALRVLTSWTAFIDGDIALTQTLSGLTEVDG